MSKIIKIINKKVSSNGYTQFTTKSTVKKEKAWTIGFFLPCAFTNFLLDRQTL